MLGNRPGGVYSLQDGDDGGGGGDLEMMIRVN